MVCPLCVITLAGWLADTGAVYGARTGGRSYGWLGTALNQTVDRDWLGWTIYDTYNQPWKGWATTGAKATWECALANGTYPVVIVCGDAHSIQQRTDLVVEGATWLDPKPWNGTTPEPTTGQLGNFVALSGVVTIADGKLTITAAATAKAPKICFLQIGAAGSTFDANFTARTTAALNQATSRTTNGRPDEVKPQFITTAYGSYVDEVLGYRVQLSTGPYATTNVRFVHANHLYSVAAVTSATGAVVERYAYNAYGARTVKDAAGVVIAKTAIGNRRGFTGYGFDGESGLYYARARMYSAKLGRFVSRDPAGYVDGSNLYTAYYIPNGVDPSGLVECAPWNKVAEKVLDQAGAGLFQFTQVGKIEDRNEREVVQEMTRAGRAIFVYGAPIEILGNIAGGLPGVTPIGILKDKVKDIVISKVKDYAKGAADPDKPFEILGGEAKRTDECDCYYVIIFVNKMNGAQVTIEAQLDKSAPTGNWVGDDFTFKGSIKSVVTSTYNANDETEKEGYEFLLGGNAWTDINGSY